jgi:hypothetical protein
VYHTYILPAEDAVAKELLQAKQEYHERTAALGAKHRLGSPHGYLAMELLDSLRAPATGVKMATLEAVYHAFENDPPGMPRAADFFKNLKVRLIPPANSHPRHRDRDRDDDRELPAPATPRAAGAEREADGGGRAPSDPDRGPRLIIEIFYNPLHRQTVQIEGRPAQGIELMAQVISEIEQGLRLHGASEEAGAPPPSKREKQLRQALRR